MSIDCATVPIVSCCLPRARHPLCLGETPVAMRGGGAAGAAMRRAREQVAGATRMRGRGGAGCDMDARRIRGAAKASERRRGGWSGGME